MPIGKTLSEILDVIKDTPQVLSGDKTRVNLKIICGRMEFTKHVTAHTARHSACSMFAQLRLPKSVAAELLGITEKVVSVYYHLEGIDILEQTAVLREI